MSLRPIPLPSLELTVEKVVGQLMEQRDTALVAAPGCGAASSAAPTPAAETANTRREEEAGSAEATGNLEAESSLRDRPAP